MRPLILSLCAAFVACNRLSEDKPLNARTSSSTAIADAADLAGLPDAMPEVGGDTLGVSAEFEKARTDYSLAKTRDLAAIDQRIAGVELKTVGKKGPSKADYEASLVEIRGRRAQLALDIRAIAGTSPGAWNDMTRRVDSCCCCRDIPPRVIARAGRSCIRQTLKRRKTSRHTSCDAACDDPIVPPRRIVP